MILADLVNKKLLTTPVWLPTNTMMLATMGSIAYGVAEDTSDFDVYGFCIPPKKDVFPYAEKLYGFDNVSVFEQFQHHHVLDKNALGGKGREYDFTIFSIVKYFKLCLKEIRTYWILFSSHNLASYTQPKYQNLLETIEICS